MVFCHRAKRGESDTRHVLSRSLGNELFVSADISEHLLLPGDVLLLSSDGLHGAVPEADLAKAVSGER